MCSETRLFYRCLSGLAHLTYTDLDRYSLDREQHSAQLVACKVRCALPVAPCTPNTRARGPRVRPARKNHFLQSFLMVRAVRTASAHRAPARAGRTELKTVYFLPSFTFLIKINRFFQKYIPLFKVNDKFVSNILTIINHKKD